MCEPEGVECEPEGVVCEPEGVECEPEGVELWERECTVRVLVCDFNWSAILTGGTRYYWRQW